LTNATRGDGEYELTVVPTGLSDAAGNPLVGAARSWTISTDPNRYNADFNGDDLVDLVDFDLLKTHFFSGTTRAEGDADGDGDVDLFDFGMLKAQFGGPPPGAPPAALAAAADQVFDSWGR
jgi:hypothetical protein